MCKRIISLFLVIATVCGVLVVPVSATEALPPAGSDSGGSSGSVGLGLDIVDFVDWSLEEATYNLKLIGSIFIDELCPEREGSNFSHSFIVDTVLVDGVLGDYYVCQYCGRNSGYTADAHGFDSAYNQYVSSLESTVGSYSYGCDSNGEYLCFVFPSYSVSPATSNSGYLLNDDACELGTTTIIRGSADLIQKTDYQGCSVNILYYSIKAPLSGKYTTYYTDSFTGVSASHSSMNFRPRVDVSISAGEHMVVSTYYPGNSAYYAIVPRFYADMWTPVSFEYTITAYAKLYPTVSVSENFGANTRPSSIVGDYGIIGDDGTIIKVDGNMIVDESTNTVFNPVTNVTNNYTDYAFDYSDRSYNLTLEDGSTLKVVYGDENVTIHEGDTIYNIYYLIPDDSGSGDEPGTGDDPGSGDTPGGEDMSWWKEAWTNFTDKLFSILGNVGSSVNPDTAPAVPDDEETGEKGYSVIDLFVVLKDGTWAFITGIVSTAYDGFTGFVESVSSAGSFFTFYDEESEDGILFVPLEGGETIWD